MPKFNNDWHSYLRFRDEFAEAMDTRFYTIGWLDHQVSNNIFRLFCADDAAIIAKMVRYPTGAKAVKGVYQAGNPYTAVGKLIPLAELWGSEEGANYARIASRPAWQRMLTDYHLYKTDIIKEIHNG
jgi:hypothetical protein